MKKFALALVAATAISGAQAEMGTGMYLGVNGAMNFVSSDVKITDLTDNSVQTMDMGRGRPGVGMYLGYAMASGCMYYAGEMGYQYLNADYRFSSTAPLISGKFKVDHQFNFALNIGYKLTPATVGYIRLGGNWNRFKLSSNISSMTDSKSRITFAPGLGVETALNRNWIARMEWTYDMGRNFKRTANGVVTFDADRVHTQSVKLGVAYKF